MGSRIYIYCAAHEEVIKKISNGRVEEGFWICEECVKKGKKPKTKEGGIVG